MDVLHVRILHLDGVDRDPLADVVVPATDFLPVEADPAALLAL